MLLQKRQGLSGWDKSALWTGGEVNKGGGKRILLSRARHAQLQPAAPSYRVDGLVLGRRQLLSFFDGLFYFIFRLILFARVIPHSEIRIFVEYQIVLCCFQIFFLHLFFTF